MSNKGSRNMKRKSLKPSKVCCKSSRASTIWFSSQKPPDRSRFMESAFDFDAVHWDHEPARRNSGTGGTPVVFGRRFALSAQQHFSTSPPQKRRRRAGERR